MNGEISILIADDNREFGEFLCKELRKYRDFDVVGVAKDGLQVLEYIKGLRPEIVILDVIMPNLDGIGVLERISQLNISKKPSFIMLSAIGHDLFIQKAVMLGAEYYLIKPFDLNVLITRIRQIYKERRSSYISTEYKFSKKESKYLKPATVSYSGNPDDMDIESEVTHLMRDVGIPPHMAGYQYLREAIMQTIDDPKTFNSVTKVLYPKVAVKYNTTPQKVERSIRNAIESAWIRGNHDSIDSLFGYTVSYSKGKPTNSEFIAMMADKVRIMKASLKKQT